MNWQAECCGPGRSRRGGEEAWLGYVQEREEVRGAGGRDGRSRVVPGEQRLEGSWRWGGLRRRPLLVLVSVLGQLV